MGGYVSGLYYEALIENIPPRLNVLSFVSGSTVSAVETEIGVGLCETLHDNRFARLFEGATPVTLRAFAGMARSRNYTEASLGMAAINAYYNNSMPAAYRMKQGGSQDANPLTLLAGRFTGKRVALIGRDNRIERTFGAVCDLIIVDGQSAGAGVLPIAAASFVCPDCDAVLADCKSLVRKQLPRLLACTERLILAGLGVPAATLYGTDRIETLVCHVVTDPQMTLHLVRKGAPAHEIAESCQVRLIESASDMGATENRNQRKESRDGYRSLSGFEM